jgi:hypothetical protein
LTHKAIGFLGRLMQEAPLRLFGKAWVKRFSNDIHTIARWDAAERPNYLLGVLMAAEQAKEFGVAEISVAEFGVAGGAGLLCLQSYAQRVQAATGVKIHVLGFDTGAGLPLGTGDHRDHPEFWSAGDYPMQWDQLQPRLGPQTRLILGDVRETVPQFVRDELAAPLGFISIDVDLYSSTRDALRILSMPERKMLIRTLMYFDDVEAVIYHRFAGELLAIAEFNRDTPGVKIDRWRTAGGRRPFPEEGWLRQMYVAYDLEAIDRIDRNRKRGTRVLDLSNVENSSKDKITT